MQWGLEHRQLGLIVAIGVDEIQYGDEHKYLTLSLSDRAAVHPRLLWIVARADHGELRSGSSP